MSTSDSFDADDCGFEAQLASLDREREAQLAALMKALDDRLYFGAPPDDKFRVGDGRGTFSRAAPQAELEWRPLNRFVRAVGIEALEKRGGEEATPKPHEPTALDAVVSSPGDSAGSSLSQIPHSYQCPDCAILKDLDAGFKFLDALPRYDAPGTAGGSVSSKPAR